MKSSLNIGSYAGIPVKVHWTFAIIVFFVAFIIWRESYNLKESFSLSLYVISLFVCVVLHEYGHALAARRYGVHTMDIILSPIGGLARLERIPKKPGQELWIAIAGPLVNLVIALILLMAILVFGQFEGNPEDTMTMLVHPVGFMNLLLWLNLVLFAFNLIPAFPMDGGRILRALLSYKLERIKATFIASVVGRILSLGFIGVGVYYNHYALILIGMFVYFMAFREYQYMRFQEARKQADFQQVNEINGPVL